MRFTERPRPVERRDYTTAIDRMVERVARFEGCCAVYQLGSVGTPGISDVDLLVVFEDGVACSENPLAGMPEADRYLFVHALFGLSRSLFEQAQHYTTLFENCRSMWGEALPIHAREARYGTAGPLKRQLALEYLLANYIAKTMERATGLLSVRKLFLNVKGLRYDLECLGIREGALYDLLTEALVWREAWFEMPVVVSRLEDWFRAFYRALHQTLGRVLAETPLYFPDWIEGQFARNVRVAPGAKLGFAQQGLRLPAWPGRTVQKIRRRLLRFTFTVPVTRVCPHPVLDDRFAFLRDLKRYNARHLPHFADLDGQLGRLVSAH